MLKINKELECLVIDNGGAVVRKNNPKSYQICWLQKNDKIDMKDLNPYYYNGSIYSYTLIRKSIEEGEFCSPKSHFVCQVTKSKLSTKRRK